MLSCLYPYSCPDRKRRLVATAPSAVGTAPNQLSGGAMPAGRAVLLLLGVIALAPAVLAVPTGRAFKTCRRVTRGGCTCLDECAKSRWGGFVCSVQRGKCHKAAFPHYDWCCPDKKQSCCVDVQGRPHNYFASTSTSPTGQKSIHQQVKDVMNT